MNIKKPENWINETRDGEVKLEDIVQYLTDEQKEEYYDEALRYINTTQDKENSDYYKFFSFMLKYHPYNLLNAILSNGLYEMTLDVFKQCLDLFTFEFWGLQSNTISRHFNFDIPGICEWDEVYEIYETEKRRIEYLNKANNKSIKKKSSIRLIPITK